MHPDVGLGSLFGVGYRAHGYGSPTTPGVGENLHVGLPTVELAFAVAPDVEVSVSIPLGTTIGFAATGSFVWGTSVFAIWFFGGPNASLMLGPGVGCDVSYLPEAAYDPRGSAASYFGADLRLTGVVGLEVLTDSRYFAFRAALRPWLTLGGGTHAFESNGGVLGELGVVGFFPS